MKNIGIVLVMLFLFGQGFAQRRKTSTSEEVVTTSEVSTSTFSRTGIYEGQIGSTAEPLEVLEGIFMIVVSLEEAARGVLKEKITTGFTKGVIVPDYIKNPQTGKIAAYSFVVESQEEENKAIRFISFDSNVVSRFSRLAFDKNGNPQKIYLSGIPINIPEASKLLGVDLAPSGEAMESFLLATPSLEETANPGIVLVSSTLLRQAESEAQSYSPGKGIVREVKVSLLVYDEMVERTLIKEQLLPYLQTKEFLVVRAIWSKESSGSDSRSKTWKDTSRDQLQTAPSEVNRSRGFQRPD